jgi:hypothetical protein
VSLFACLNYGEFFYKDLLEANLCPSNSGGIIVIKLIIYF